MFYMKVLISCYACSPYKGSEPGMGWNFVNGIARYCEVHVLVESKFEKDINQYFIEHPEDMKYFHFYFIRKERHRTLRKIWPPSYYWFYKSWQKKACRLAKELDKINNFDIVHQLNMVGYREPGYLYRLNKPLVWGPIGGMCISPWCLLPSIGTYGAIYYGLRNILNILQAYCKWRVRIYAQKSDAIIAATQDNYDGILKIWHKQPVILSEVGLLNTEVAKPLIRNKGCKLNVVWSGQHTPGKALNLLLEAISQLQFQDGIELHVIGAGMYTNKWKKLAKKKKINNVVWHGWVERSEALKIMKKCHLLCITSIADLTSTVLLEALSLGLPVIALNHCGFANVIEESCGIKIDINTKKQVVNDYAQAIGKLYNDESYRRMLSQGAFARAQDFSWNKKIDIIRSIYKGILIKKG